MCPVVIKIKWGKYLCSLLPLKELVPEYILSRWSMAKNVDQLDVTYKVKYKPVLRKVCDNASLTRQKCCFFQSQAAQTSPIALTLSIKSKCFPGYHSGLATITPPHFWARRSLQPQLAEETVLILLAIVCSEWFRKPLIHQPPAPAQMVCSALGDSSRETCTRLKENILLPTACTGLEKQQNHPYNQTTR